MKKSVLIPCMDWIVKDSVVQIHQPCQKIILPIHKDEQLCIDKMVAYVDACFEGNAEKLKIVPGIGIAAPQLGCYKQIFYINFADRNAIHHKLLMANPLIVSESLNDAYLGEGEGCLSVDKEYCGYARRKAWVIVNGYDLEKKESVKIKATGLFAICIQHEIDHLNGILYYDRINKFEPFKKLDDDQVY